MRGYQRKVIFLKDTGSHLFDEAYFVVSRKGEEASIGKGDMIFEANRIIKESLTYREKRAGGIKSLLRLDFIIPFLVGALAGFLITSLIYFLLK